MNVEQYRIIEKALEHAEENAVCNCSVNEKTGTVTYHSNCQRHNKRIYIHALAVLREAKL